MCLLLRVGSLVGCQSKVFDLAAAGNRTWSGASSRFRDGKLIVDGLYRRRQERALPLSGRSIVCATKSETAGSGDLPHRPPVVSIDVLISSGRIPRTERGYLRRPSIRCPRIVLLSTCNCPSRRPEVDRFRFWHPDIVGFSGFDDRSVSLS